MWAGARGRVGYGAAGKDNGAAPEKRAGRCGEARKARKVGMDGGCFRQILRSKRSTAQQRREAGGWSEWMAGWCGAWQWARPLARRGHAGWRERGRAPTVRFCRSCCALPSAVPQMCGTVVVGRGKERRVRAVCMPPINSALVRRRLRALVDGATPYHRPAPSEKTQWTVRRDNAPPPPKRRGKSRGRGEQRGRGTVVAVPPLPCAARGFLSSARPSLALSPCVCAADCLPPCDRVAWFCVLSKAHSGRFETHRTVRTKQNWQTGKQHTARHRQENSSAHTVPRESHGAVQVCGVLPSRACSAASSPLSLRGSRSKQPPEREISKGHSTSFCKASQRCQMGLKDKYQ
jgi:hypothetical protein